MDIKSSITTNEDSQAIVQEYSNGLVTEFQALTHVVVALKNQIDTAKTKFKKDYFKKKLTKANKRAYRLLAHLQWMDAVKKAKALNDKEALENLAKQEDTDIQEESVDVINKTEV